MRRTRLSRVRLVVTDARHAADVALLTAEHTNLHAEIVDACGVLDPVVDASAWTCARDFRPWDEAMEISPSEAISVRGAGRDVARVACEVATRYQRWIDRRNEASRTPVFDAVLRAHAGVHDCDKPLVRADFDHALDTWQWMLRLDPEASLPAQLAALFHDVERLESEAERRVEHRASDAPALEDAHARRAGDRAYEILVAAGVEPAAAERARHLVAKHERRGADPEIDLVNDADALSFFSLGSAGYIDDFGVEQTKKKVRDTLGRMSERARERLARVRLRADVAPILTSAWHAVASAA